MAGMAEVVRAGNSAFEQRRDLLREIADETERIVRAQATGLQQVRDIAEAEAEAALVSRGEGGGGGTGGILDQGGLDAVIGLLVGALTSGGGGHAAAPPRFQPGPPILWGAQYASRWALWRDGGALTRLNSGHG